MTHVLHVPVLLHEVVAALAPSEGEVLVDCTLGLGGHTEALLQAAPCRVIGLDRDPWALQQARRRLAPFADRFTAVHSPFARLGEVLDELGLDHVDGILADLGVSSPQLDERERGFSFQGGPLDMRMDSTQELCADQVVNQWSEGELARLVRRFGEEPRAAAIARAIVKERPIRDNEHLARVVATAARADRRRRVHPATRTFQAIRVAVNDELGQLRELLSSATSRLSPGGRLAIISFHSLEDRLVKKHLATESGRGTPRDPWGHPVGPVRLSSRPKAVQSSPDDPNPRSRSARLRTAVRLP